MTPLAFVAASSLALGLLAFSAWTVRVFVTSALDPKADWTSRVIYHHGQAVIWLAALASAGSVLGVVAHAVWKLVGA